MEARPRRRRVPWFLGLVAFPSLGAVLLWAGSYLSFEIDSNFLYITALVTSLAVPTGASVAVMRRCGYGVLPTAALSVATLALVAGLGFLALLALLYAGSDNSVCPGGDVYC